MFLLKSPRYSSWVAGKVEQNADSWREVHEEDQAATKPI